MLTINDLEGNDLVQDIEQARDELSPGVVIERVSHEREIDVESHDWNQDVIEMTNDRNEQVLGRPDGRPDALMEVTFPLYGASMTRAYLEAGRVVGNIPFLHHHGWRNDQILVKLSAFDLEGQVGISHAIIDNCDGSGRIFAEAMQNEFESRPGFLDAQTYDAVFVLALATLVATETNDISRPADVSPEQIRDAMHLINDEAGTSVSAGADGFADAVRAVRGGETIDYVGASGPVDFDDLGNVVSNFVKYEVRDGRFEDVRTYRCVDDESCPQTTEVCSY